MLLIALLLRILSPDYGAVTVICPENGTRSYHFGHQLSAIPIRHPSLWADRWGCHAFRDGHQAITMCTDSRRTVRMADRCGDGRDRYMNIQTASSRVTVRSRCP